MRGGIPYSIYEWPGGCLQKQQQCSGKIQGRCRRCRRLPPVPASASRCQPVRMHGWHSRRHSQALHSQALALSQPIAMCPAPFCWGAAGALPPAAENIFPKGGSALPKGLWRHAGLSRRLPRHHTRCAAASRRGGPVGGAGCTHLPLRLLLLLELALQLHTLGCVSVTPAHQPSHLHRCIAL